MTREDFLAASLLCGVLVISGIAGCSMGVSIGVTKARGAAIEAGVAEYTIDHKTGETSFVYKTCK